VWKQVGLTIGDIHIIINNIIEMLGDYSKTIEGEYIINRSTNKNDIDDLINILVDRNKKEKLSHK
jgi:hypothetical protein